MNKHIQSFDNFILESKGISRPIFGILKQYFADKGSEASFEDAKEIVADQVEGWDLSKEDFEEAKKKFM
jgi:hypothetical protein